MTQPPALALEDAVALVRANARLLRLPLDDARAQRVAEHLQRTAAIARRLEALDLGPADELAEIFRLDRPAAGDRIR